MFSNKNHDLQKKTLYKKNSFFSADCVNVTEIHVVRTLRHMQSD